MSVVSLSGSRTSGSADVKQFSTTISVANWIYKKVNNLLFVTPEKKEVPVVIQGNLTVEKDLTVKGSIYSPSDERLKQNVSNINEEAINNLMTLNPIIYEYKYEPHKQHYGVLAQEMENVFPELVEEKKVLESDDEYKTVNYVELVPIMLAKMKQMQNEINELKSINELKQQKEK